MLTVHHLGKSQSERIVWLCEELAIPYELKRYTRDPVTILAPADYKALHAIGAAPVITDGDLVLAESGAVVEYIIAKYGRGRLALNLGHRDFAPYLYWYHFANGTLQAGMGRNMILNRLKLADDNPILLATRARLDRAFDLVDARTREVEYLAGSEFTAADIMMASRSPPCAISCPTISSAARISCAISPASAPARPIAGRWRKAIRGWPCC